MIPHSKPWITEEDLGAVNRTLGGGMIARGEQVRAFEDQVARYVGAVDAIAVGSGTAALTLALNCLEAERKDEVILPTYVCRSVADAVARVGLTPILCDVGEHWTMTADTVAPHVSARTRAIIVVHLYGIAAETAAFRRFGVPLIEDCCQALGGERKRQRVAATGELSVFSFHATKCLATGEGGMVTARSPEAAERLQAVCQSTVLTAPMSDLQAALGLAQLARYPDMLARRRYLAERYLTELPRELTRHIAAQEGGTIYFRFPLRTSEGPPFDAIRAEFHRAGVVVRRGVDELLHRRCEIPDDHYPNATRLFAETVSVPLYPAMSEDDQDAVIQVCRRLWK
jgi:perosamine synthetase